MTLKNGGRDIIVDISKRYGAIEYIREVIANFYNHNTNPQVHMMGLTRNLDDKHWELFQDLLIIMRSGYGVDIIEELFKEMIKNGYFPKEHIYGY